MTAAKPAEIWFVTWPDGKVMDGTQTSISEGHAIGAAIVSFLPARWFPDLKVDSGYAGVGYHLWPAMKKAGFLVQSVTTEAIGVSR